MASIAHAKEISHVRFVADTCLVTASVDKWVKVWHMPDGPTGKNIKLVAQFKAENEVMHLQYSPDQKMLAYLDCQCSLGAVHLSDSLIRG